MPTVRKTQEEPCSSEDVAEEPTSGAREIGSGGIAQTSICPLASSQGGRYLQQTRKAESHRVSTKPGVNQTDLFLAGASRLLDTIGDTAHLVPAPCTLTGGFPDRTSAIG